MAFGPNTLWMAQNPTKAPTRIQRMKWRMAMAMAMATATEQSKHHFFIIPILLSSWLMPLLRRTITDLLHHCLLRHL